MASVLKLKTPNSSWVPSVPGGCWCRAWEVSKRRQRGARVAQGAHFSKLGLLSRALYLSGTPSDVSTTSTSVKMVITFSKGEKDGEKRVFQVACHHTRICLEPCWLLLPLLRHPSGAEEWGRMASHSSAGVQGAPGAGAGRIIFKGNTTGLQSQSGNPN